MIEAKICVRFDEKGKKRIEEAVYTLQDIAFALDNKGDNVSGLKDDLEQASASLRAILDGTYWG